MELTDLLGDLGIDGKLINAFYDFPHYGRLIAFKRFLFLL